MRLYNSVGNRPSCFRLNVSHIGGMLALEPTAISDFWTPDSYFRYAKRSSSVLVMQPSASLTVLSDKSVVYSQVRMITLACPMAFVMYPFDTQVHSSFKSVL